MDRRDFLKRVAWAGTGLALSMSAGVARSRVAPVLVPANQGYPQGVPWVSMRGNRQNTGISPLVGFNFTNNGKTPILSSADTNQDGISLINATPIIGTVGTDEVVFIGSSNNHFYSFDPITKTLVGASLDNIVDSAGTFFTADQIFFPGGDFSLHSAPAKDVTREIGVLMSTDGGSPSTIHWFEGNVVTDVNNRLYAGNDDFYLYCCSPAQGLYPVWLFPTGFFIWTACSFSPDNKTLYFASADMTVYALDLTTGQTTTPNEKWTFPVPNICTSSIAVDNNNVVYFGAFDGGIYALDGNTGNKIWDYQTNSLIYASPAISPDPNGVLYVISSDGVLRALNKDYGYVIWEFFTGMPSFSSTALGPDPQHLAEYLIYVGTGNGQVLALDPTGKRRWSFDTAALYNICPSNEDPAFALKFSYPAVNSSIAIGTNGIATATSGGHILWLDYLYYTNSGPPCGIINNMPEDDYISQLTEPSFCYVSPSGRMAQKILSKSPSFEVNPAQAINLTYLKKVLYGSDSSQKRSSFYPFPQQNFSITTSDQVEVSWRISADGTQLYIDPLNPPANSGPRVFTIKSGTNQLAQFTVSYQSLTNPLPADQLSNNYLLLQQASFFSPFIVPALDQLGLATITVPFRVFSLGPNTDKVWAYGYESYNAGAAGAPTRNLVYAFAGTYEKGNLVLASKPGYFELTSFPTPLTTMKVTGLLELDSNSIVASTGLSLQVEYTETTTSLINWLCQLLTHWLGFKIPGAGSICDLLQDADARAAEIGRVKAQLENEKSDSLDIYLRILYFLARVATNFQSILADWELFNTASPPQFTWAGTYNLGTLSNLQPPIPTVKYAFSDATLTSTLVFPEKYTAIDFVVGTVILGSDGQPLTLNYTDRNKMPVITKTTSNSTTVTQSIDLSDVNVTGCKALVFVDLQLVQPEHSF